MTDMNRHLFLTDRSLSLPGWLAAFPEARVRAHPASGDEFTDTAVRLAWIHVGPADDVAARVRVAARVLPGARLIVLANVPGQNQGLAALEAGAAGYLSALAAPELLRQVASVIENGGLWVGPELLDRLLAAIAPRDGARRAPAVLDRLTPREREVALAVAGGAANKEIANRLGIAERTVKAHLGAIYETLGVRDRLQLSLLINGLPKPGN